MSNFGIALKALLKKKQMKARKLSEASRVDASMISRYINAERFWVNSEDARAIADVLCSDANERGDLVRAQIFDAVPPDDIRAAKLAVISTDGNPALLDDRSFEIALPEDLESDFALIREQIIHDKDLRDIVEGLAGLIRNGDCRTRDELSEKTIKQLDAEGTKRISSPKSSRPVSYRRSNAHMRGSLMHDAQNAQPSAGTVSDSGLRPDDEPPRKGKSDKGKK